MISSCIESDIVIVSSCRAARPDPHYSRCTVNRASHRPRIMDLVKLSVLRGFFHCGTFYSSPSMKIYQEWSTPWTVFTCSARGQIPCGCWDLRTWIVKLMKNCSFCDVLFTAEHFNKNIPGIVNSMNSANVFDKGADTMRMFRAKDQNRRFDEKLAVLWRFLQCRTFDSSRSTKTYQGLSTQWAEWTCLTRVQIPCGCSEQCAGLRRTGRIPSSPGRRQKRAFAQPPISPAVGGVWNSDSRCSNCMT